MTIPPDDVAPPDEAQPADTLPEAEEVAPPPPPFYKREPVRRILWVTLFLLAFLGIGLLLPPNFWRF